MIDILCSSSETAPRWTPQDPIWWLVYIGSDNGLMPSGNKPLTWANINTDLCQDMLLQGHNELTDIFPENPHIFNMSY